MKMRKPGRKRVKGVWPRVEKKDNNEDEGLVKRKEDYPPWKGMGRRGNDDDDDE